MSDLAAAALLDALDHALFGCEDGERLPDECDLPVGEMRRLLREFVASPAAVRAELTQPRTLAHADLPRVYDLCARVCGAEDATIAGHFLGQLRDLLGPAPAPRPRVWLPGDTVPAGVWVQDVDGELWLSSLVECDEGPYVEVQTLSESTMAAAVAAEQSRRAEEGHVQCVHCGEPIRKLSQIHCLNCGNPWDGD